jgi:hypothetical protein
MFKETPKQDYIDTLKKERDVYDNKLKELQRKIKVLSAQHQLGPGKTETNMDPLRQKSPGAPSGNVTY